MVEQINLRKNMEFNKIQKFVQTKIRIAKKAILFLCHKIIMMDIDYTFFIAQGILLENVGITMTKFSWTAYTYNATFYENQSHFSTIGLSNKIKSTENKLGIILIKK